MTKNSSLISKGGLVIEETNLSTAYARLLRASVEGAGKKLSPVLLSLSGFKEDNSISEDPDFRAAMDEALHANGDYSVEIVAQTIFPQRVWQMAKGDRARFFDLYAKVFRRYKAMNRRENGRGLYFERLTMFGPNVPCNGNQLEWILSNYERRKGIRSSMFQASIFDPARDHVGQPRLGFPCLQHVSFVPVKDEGLVMNAFYATQYVFEKAYGNYLGLAQLGAFMASEMKMPLAKLNVTIGVAHFAIKKSNDALRPLLKLASNLTNPIEVPAIEKAA